MPVQICDVNLVGPIRTSSSFFIGNIVVTKITFPLIHVVDHQGVVVASTVRICGCITATDQVQLLNFSQQILRAWELKRRARNFLQLKNVFVELTTFIDVFDV